MIDSKAKDAFWDVVEDCLVEIHGLSKPAAHQRSVDLRARIESPPTGMSSEIFYHAEPFDVACDIAGRQLDLSHYRFQYDYILNRHNW
jgi:hypothetical protein